MIMSIVLAWVSVTSTRTLPARSRTRSVGKRFIPGICRGSPRRPNQADIGNLIVFHKALDDGPHVRFGRDSLFIREPDDFQARADAAAGSTRSAGGWPRGRAAPGSQKSTTTTFPLKSASEVFLPSRSGSVKLNVRSTGRSIMPLIRPRASATVLAFLALSSA